MRVTQWGTCGILAEDFSAEKKAVLMWSWCTFPRARTTLFPVGRSLISWVIAGTAQHLLPGASQGVLSKARVLKTHWRIKISVALNWNSFCRAETGAGSLSSVPSGDVAAVGVWCFCLSGHSSRGVRDQREGSVPWHSNGVKKTFTVANVKWELWVWCFWVSWLLFFHSLSFLLPFGYLILEVWVLGVSTWLWTRTAQTEQRRFQTLLTVTLCFLCHSLVAGAVSLCAHTLGMRESFGICLLRHLEIQPGYFWSGCCWGWF